MKAMFLMIAVAFFAITEMAAQSNNPLKGSWELIYLRSTYNGQTSTLDDYVSPRQMKIYGDDGAFLFVGEAIWNDTTRFNSGGGYYDYEPGKVLEHIQFHQGSREAIGTTQEFEVRFRGDTLIHSTPGKTRTSDMDGLYEEYVRVAQRVKP